jgi:hypothetical protein
MGFMSALRQTRPLANSAKVANPGDKGRGNSQVSRDSQAPDTAHADPETRLRRIAAEHNLAWCEIQRWLRPEDIEASRAYFESDDPRDREGLVFWLKILADKSIPKMPPEWLEKSGKRVTQ